MGYGPDFEWMTPEIREAQAQVDRAAMAIDELVARIEEQGLPTIPENDSAAIARQLSEAAAKSDAPAELKAMKRKVDDGRFSWLDVVTGKAADDPDVRKAQEAQMTQMKQAFQAFEEGHTLQDIINASATGRPDDGDDGNVVLRDSSW